MCVCVCVCVCVYGRRLFGKKLAVPSRSKRGRPIKRRPEVSLCCYYIEPLHGGGIW